jgi:hypothetical protein
MTLLEKQTTNQLLGKHMEKSDWFIIGLVLGKNTEELTSYL